MKQAGSCVVCGGAIFVRQQAIVAPFLARRIWDEAPKPCHLAQCRECGFLFFNPRLEPEEEQRLYGGYRQAEYQKTRQACEPWYTAKFNASISSPRFMEVRRAALAGILKANLAAKNGLRILDFGGDRGQLIQGVVPGAAEFTYDISGVQPLEGVTACRSLDECKAREADLIVCSNVLEHVGFPQTIMSQITAVAAPHTMLFIEVPFESPFGARLMLRRAIQYAVLALLRPRVAWSAAQPGFLYPMHEHINYYAPQSLNALMEKAGWQVTASGMYVLESALGGKALWCMGKLSRPTTMS